MSATHIVLATLGLAFAASAHAVPIVFDAVSSSSFAQADAGDASDGPFSETGDGSLPLVSSAAAFATDGDSASANAFAESLFLTTSSEASAVLGQASGNAVSTFTGSFNALPGRLTLSLDFDAFIDQLATGFGSNALAVTLEIDGVTLYSDLLSNSTVFDQSFLLANGGMGLLDLTLASTTLAAPGDYAFSLASVNAALDATSVPEPGGMALLAAGLLGLAWARRKSVRA